MGYRDQVNRFASTRLGSWIGSTLAARLDPWLYRISGGRLTTTLVPTLPMLLLTTTGRKSGKPRTVQIAYTEDDGTWLVVASNWGKEHHPAWSLNLEANPQANVQIGSEQIPVIAHRLSDDEKAAVWDRLVANVPNYGSYVERTDRNIRVYRLIPND
ncbi:MAG: nitroreductase family deazaflavin-dependent oxidoreductase [Candidatus Dadabacteria bacterium]|nr:MAG: nitroreductase family deazaflavin-dependent oxidoreductase [Candidatus Dadabacteria bacterium]